MFNKVVLVGRLGADPETRQSQSGVAVASFRLATLVSKRSKSGQKEEKTDWHRIIAFSNLAGFCGKYLTKGRLVLVEGHLSNRESADKGLFTEIVASTIQALDRPPDSNRNTTTPKE
ncbi:MAG: single-stranded DNA-binding protein [Syntrophales bacterium]|nr:single-stranded DNA-binding protein [Syntrophales bacterium]MDD5233675.1 single-stranded DNA-binding protein [Syntrophales bacterium]MDD5531888.1 single-stranded DNA-binding protein [Syntrophales bacterium]HPL63903.1 single-stranded DNA-binding protein [Syntrophales bacterium]